MLTGKKIALVGNVNDNHYQLFKFLCRNNIDADLLVFKCDTFKPENADVTHSFQDHIKHVKWGSPLSILTTPKHTLEKDLLGYDFYIVTRFGGIFLNKIGITNKYIHMVYGGDINILSWRMILERTRYFRNIILLPFSLLLSYFQKRSFIKSSGVCFDPPVYFRTLLTQNGLGEKHIPLGLYFDFKDSKGIPLPVQQITKLKKLRKEYDLLIFSPTRHDWQRSRDISPGNDVLIKGAHRFITSNPDCKIAFIFLEYGFPEASKKLIRKLKMDTCCYWLPSMKKGEVFSTYPYCDIVADQFVMGAYGSIYMEAAFHKKPTLLYLRPEYMGEMPPHFEARTEEEVCLSLNTLLKNPLLIKSTGNSAYDFVKRHHGESCGKRYIELLKKLLLGK